MFSFLMLNSAYCAKSTDAIPFSFNELAASIDVTSPVENFTYSDSDIVVNASVYIGGHEWEKGSRYIPYQNISCVYSLDGSEWQNMSLVSFKKADPFPSLVNNFWYNTMWLNYSVILHNVSEGSHYLKIDVKPDSIHTREESSEKENPFVYFTVAQNSNSELLSKNAVFFAILAISILFGVIAIVAVIIKRKRSFSLPNRK